MSKGSRDGNNPKSRGSQFKFSTMGDRQIRLNSRYEHWCCGNKEWLGYDHRPRLGGGAEEETSRGVQTLAQSVE